MIVKCKNCIPKEDIDIPNLTINEKEFLWKLKKESPIQAVKEILNKKMYSPIDAKFIITHINIEYGKCNKCNNKRLDSEYITCHQCKSLNFNWNIKYI